MNVTIVRELMASSPKGWQDAVEVGLERATKTVRGITAVEVVEESARVKDGRIKEYWVKLKIHFVLEED